MICIVDYGVGNLGSIHNMCKYAGIPSIISSEEDVIRSASHLLLPGVGSFDTGIKKLQQNNLKMILETEVLKGNKPILGLCLGAQLMLESSKEGEFMGLGWIKGECVGFDTTHPIKVPHMGWNNLTEIYEDTLFRNMPSYPPRFYFVHSYHFALTDSKDIAATTTYGSEFASAFRKSNIFGVQFHPEKSHKFGMQLLLNFARM